MAAGEADPAHVALLEDRVAVSEGRPRTYGTQFRRQDGDFVPLPIADPDRVDELRCSVGLDSLAEEREQMRRQYERH